MDSNVKEKILILAFEITKRNMNMNKNIPITRTFASIMFFVLTICSYGQNDNRFPVWTFHKRNVNIHGLSVGLVSTVIDERNTNTNGIKLELIGVGLFVPLIPEFPTFEEQRSERINGLSLSALGTVCDCLTNGLSIGGGSQLNYQVNGIALATMVNISEKQNGIMIATGNFTKITNGFQLGLTNGSSKINGVQIAFSVNESEKVRGLQIGIVNKTENLRGVQIGIWNVNEKRKLPLINWNFRRTKERETNE